MADAKTPEDDKSINDLLKEYASDVKDKDIDDFLKDSGEDEAFESADEEDDDAQDGEDAVETAPQRKSSAGVLTMLLIVVAFGAAGAGAWVYLNRDQGMTAIMGGFMGGQDDANAPASQMPPPPPIASSTMPAPANDMTPPAPMPDAPAQPMPIMNDSSAAPAPAGANASAPMPAPNADMGMPAGNAIPAPAAPKTATKKTGGKVATAAPAPLTAPAPAATTAPAATLTPAGEDTNAQNAVSAWNGDASATMPPANTDAKAPLPEKPIASVKAKAIPAPKQAKKTEPLIEKKTASTPPVAKISSGADGALPPPYMAIQAKKVSGVNTAYAAPAPTPTAPMPSAMMKAVPPSFTQGSAPTAPAEPALKTIPLAINGGRSMPDNGNEKAYAQIPDTTNGTAPAPAVSAPSAPVMPSAPAPQATSMPDTTPVAAVPAAPAPSGNGQAAGLVAQGDAAAKSGDNDKAISLYEQALEADAVYGDGKSIDRGSVYDRIGAIKNGHQ